VPSGSGRKERGQPMVDVRSDDTAPMLAVDYPMSPTPAGRAVSEVASVLLIRCIVAGVATLVLLVLTVLLFRNGIRADTFPAYQPGTTHTIIKRYSAPWIAGSAGTALLAALCFTSFSADLYRRMRLQRRHRSA
jgi:hypothetical protein